MWPLPLLFKGIVQSFLLKIHFLHIQMIFSPISFYCFVVVSVRPSTYILVLCFVLVNQDISGWRVGLFSSVNDRGVALRRAPGKDGGQCRKNILGDEGASNRAHSKIRMNIGLLYPLVSPGEKNWIVTRSWSTYCWTVTQDVNPMTFLCCFSVFWPYHSDHLAEHYQFSQSSMHKHHIVPCGLYLPCQSFLYEAWLVRAGAGLTGCVLCCQRHGLNSRGGAEEHWEKKKAGKNYRL